MFSQACVIPSVHRGLHPMQWAGGEEGCIPPYNERGGVYPSMQWDMGVCGRHPWADTPPRVTATEAGGTHPTALFYKSYRFSQSMYRLCKQTLLSFFSKYVHEPGQTYHDITSIHSQIYFLDIILSKHFEKS